MGQRMHAAERSRPLPQMNWASGQLVSKDIPRDTVAKALILRFSGSVAYTFASSPVAFEYSTMDNLISRVNVSVAGGVIIKSVRPHLAHMEQLLATQIQGERKASAAAAAATGNNPLADSGFVYGVTTNTTTVAETIKVSFEMVLAKKLRETTYLNLKGLSSAELQLICGTTAGLDKTTNATFSAAAFVIDVTLIEVPSIPAGTSFSIWRQTTKDILITAATTEYPIDITRGNYLAGIKLFAVQDANGASATTAYRKQPTNQILDTIKFMLNGSQQIKSTTYYLLQAENRARFGVSAPYASSASRLDGFAYLDFLDDGDLSTMLSLRPGVSDNAQLLVTTKATDATYCNYPISVTVETGEIVTP